MGEGDPRRELAPNVLFADRFEIVALLGRGGMGEVYRARDLAVGEDVALKVLTIGGEPHGAELMRFRQEVRLARRVTHPNVARVYDIGDAGGVVYLTMEFVEGRTLREMLRVEKRLPPERVIAIARAACAGLSAAHAASVIHRDLKPANVLIDKSDRVVILDSGVARSLHDNDGLTQGAIGTPGYMAPEQVIGGQVDERTDLYSLGLLLHELLAGELPTRFGAANLRDVPGVPPALAKIIERCRAPLPSERFRSAGEVARALDRLEVSPAPAASFAAAASAIATEAPTRQEIFGVPTPSVATASARTIAVLPFRLRGPHEALEVCETIADELVDHLARTRGYRVFGPAAIGRLRDDRDARLIGRELGASAVVDGSVTMLDGRFRVAARLVETSSGLQLWSETHEGELCHVFDVAASLARRVAEALRLEIEIIAHKGSAPPEAVEAYLAARHLLRVRTFEANRAATEDLRRCLALAPEFQPALAGLAIACIRCWFLADPDRARAWETEARDAVERARAAAAELPETHLASAMLATQYGHYAEAAAAAHRALEIAPTFADALAYLGGLECEAGLGSQGVPRLKTAITLDPTLSTAAMALAFQAALSGDYAAFDRVFAKLEATHGERSIVCVQVGVRVGTWRGDIARVEKLLRFIPKNPPSALAISSLYARSVLGLALNAEVDEVIAGLLDATYSPRFLSLALQLETELYALSGRFDEAELTLVRAATNVLLDINWIDRCPLLGPLRGRPTFEAARARVTARAATMQLRS